MLDRAKELSAIILNTPALRADPEFVGFLIQAAVGAGDIELLKTISDWQVHPEISRRINLFVEELQRLGLEPHFKQHQSIVQSMVYGLQSSYLAIFFERETIELSVYIYVNETRDERRLLEDRIDDALAGYYRENGVGSGQFVPLITTHVLDISARHPPRII